MDIPSFRASIDLISVIGSRLQLTQRAHEYKAYCPFHAEKTASFTVSPSKGFWHCFGCKETGDAIDFIRMMDGVSFLEACKILREEKFAALPTKTGAIPKKKPTPTWISETPPADIATPASFLSPDGLAPSATWTYRDVNGAVSGYVCRYDVEEHGEKGKKFHQFTYGKYRNIEEPARWSCKSWTIPRPLYGLELLKAHPETQVIVVEGEKACDAAQALFPKHLCITWSGGAGAVNKTDWSPIYGRRVIVIPDNDPAGQEACSYLCALLTINQCTVSTIIPEATRTKGWDLADAIADHWSPIAARQWATENIKAYESSLDKPAPSAEEPPADCMPVAFSEDALAMEFVKQHGNDWRYIAENKVWLHWNGKFWEEDKVLGIEDTIKHTLRLIAQYPESDVLQEPQKKSLTSRRAQVAVAAMASSDPIIVSRSDAWDTDPWLLSTPAGIIDLRVGQLREARREDYHSKCTKASAAGASPIWLDFLAQITAGDIHLQSYLKRLCGYCLTGVTTEQIFAFFYGTGGNGKGVFLNTVQTIMGEYSASAPMATFVEQYTESHPTELASLQGKRLVTAQETEEGRKWAESRIKAITGGDMVTARYMRQNFFQYKPLFKLVFAGNHKPAIKNVDEAMRRRIHIVPFTVTIPADKRDHALTDKLKEEHGGILQWMIDGCIEWQREGLNPPYSVTKATDTYLEGEDALQLWINQCCLTGDTYAALLPELYRSYAAYCEEAKEKPITRKRLGDALAAKGIDESLVFGMKTYNGIGLKE